MRDAPRTTPRRRWVAAPVVALLSALLVSAGCRSKTSAPADDSPRELVGEPTRPTPPPGTSSPARRSEDQPPIRRGALWYRLELDDEYLAVTARLLEPAAQTSFFLPDSGTDEATREAAFTMQGARGPDGALPVEQSPKQGRLEIETAGQPWVEIAYRVDLTAFPTPSNRATPGFSNGKALVYAPDVLAVPSQQVVSAIREIPIEIHTPTDWTLRATWPQREDKRSQHSQSRRVRGFVAEDVRSLRDAFFVAGADLQTRRLSTEGEPVTVAFGPELGYSRDDVARLVGDTVGLYRRQFGSVGPVLAYFHADNAETDGVQGTAKRRGFVVRIDDEAAHPSETALLVAHEAFHLWNGHELVPAPNHDNQTRWFEEGATHYLALKTLFRTGLFDHDALRRELARSAFYYRRNPAARGRKASQLDVHRLPYDRGLLLALRFDAVLTRCTDGTRGIDAWIEALLDRETHFYDPDSLRRTLERVAGDDCARATRIWRQRVASRAPLDPAEIFAEVGLHLLEAPTLEETKLLPVDNRSRLYRRLFSRASTPDKSETHDRPAASTRTATPGDDDDDPQ